MVLVILLPLSPGELENCTCDTTEVDGLLHTVLFLVSQVRKQRAIEDALDFLDPVLLRLTGGEVPLEECDGVIGCVETVGLVGLLVETVLDVGVDDGVHLGVGGDDLADLCIGLHSECLHECDDRDCAGGGGNGDHDHSILLLLDQGECAVSVLLGEHLCDLDACAVPLAVLDHDPVGCKVFECDEDPLGSSDDEVSSRIPGVFLGLDELLEVLGIADVPLLCLLDVGPVENASSGLDHDRELSDLDAFVGRVPAGVGKNEPSLGILGVECEIDLDGCLVGDISESGLHRCEVVLVSVRLLDGGGCDVDGSGRLVIDVAALIPRPSDTDVVLLSARTILIELDDSALRIIGGTPHVIQNCLHPVVRLSLGCDKVVEGRDVVVNDAVLLKIKIYQIPHRIIP